MASPQLSPIQLRGADDGSGGGGGGGSGSAVHSREREPHGDDGFWPSPARAAAQSITRQIEASAAASELEAQVACEEAAAAAAAAAAVVSPRKATGVDGQQASVAAVDGDGGGVGAPSPQPLPEAPLPTSAAAHPPGRGRPAAATGVSLIVSVYSTQGVFQKRQQLSGVDLGWTVLELKQLVRRRSRLAIERQSLRVGGVELPDQARLGAELGLRHQAPIQLFRLPRLPSQEQQRRRQRLQAAATQVQAVYRGHRVRSRVQPAIVDEILGHDPQPADTARRNATGRHPTICRQLNFDAVRRRPTAVLPRTGWLPLLCLGCLGAPARCASLSHLASPDLLMQRAPGRSTMGRPDCRWRCRHSSCWTTTTTTTTPPFLRRRLMATQGRTSVTL
eukprot:COSAG01_NODE_5912_length_3958_cov_9.685411_3_plen_391_part_00